MKLLDKLMIKPDGKQFASSFDAVPLLTATVQKQPDTDIANTIVVHNYIIYATISKSFSATSAEYELAREYAMQSVLHTLYDDVACLTREAIEAVYAHDRRRALDVLLKLDSLIGGKNVSL